MGRLIMAVLASLAVALGLVVSPAAAATKASATSDGTRIVVTFTGKKPSKARLVAGGKSYKLSRSGKTWRTRPLSAAELGALSGKRATIKMTVGGKKRTAKATISGGGSVTPPPDGTVTPPGGGTAPPLFAAPGVDSTGDPAWNAVKGYFADSTLTDCPAGWPNCAVEERYGIFADGTTWYCRLTSTSGSDVRSVGSITDIIGAEQKADGSWGVSYQINTYGNIQHYTVRVAANGAAVMQWWGTGVSISDPPSEVKTGLVWMRGAKDCSY